MSIPAGPVAARSRWPEHGLCACAFALLPVLALASKGIAPLFGIAGVLALILAWPPLPADWQALKVPALIFAAALAWGLLSSLWAVDAQRSLLIAARLTGSFAAILALGAAAERVVRPRRLVFCLVAGLALGLVLIAGQYVTDGMLSTPFRTRGFEPPALNQVENALVLLSMPLAAGLWLLGRRRLAIAAAGATAVAICALVGTVGKLAFAVGVGVAVVLYLTRGRAAAGLAAATVVAVLTVPLTLPALNTIAPARAVAASFYKWSVRHRLEIWSFAGARVAERPYGGWGLDSSRRIPGGDAPIPGGFPWQQKLPLHPHNMPLQAWLELGLPGALLFAALAAWLWRRLGAIDWPRPYAAAAGGALFVAQAIGFGAYGLWEEWWIGTQGLTLFLILVIARAQAAVIPGPARGGGARNP